MGALTLSRVERGLGGGRWVRSRKRGGRGKFKKKKDYVYGRNEVSFGKALATSAWGPKIDSQNRLKPYKKYILVISEPGRQRRVDNETCSTHFRYRHCINNCNNKKLDNARVIKSDLSILLLHGITCTAALTQVCVRMCKHTYMQIEIILLIDTFKIKLLFTCVCSCACVTVCICENAHTYM